MTMRKLTGFLGMLLSFALVEASAHAQVQEDVVLARHGDARAAIVLGSRATAIERMSAEELARYVEEMSGARLPIGTVARGQWPGVSDGSSLVLIGRAETNPLIGRLVEEARVRLSPRGPGLDGFILKTARLDGRPTLVLGGSMDRSALYAVYDLLERVFKVGFFEDGEQVPRLEELSVPALDVRERPRFSLRMFLQGCSFLYTSQWWDWPDWERELAWAAKKKFNAVFLPMGLEVIHKKVNARFGLPSAPPSEWERFQEDLTRRCIAYAQERGMSVVLVGTTGGAVSPEFQAAHPDAHYLETEWMGVGTKTVWLSPSDPLYAEREKAWLEEMAATYGDIGNYMTSLGYAEQKIPGLSQEEIEKLSVESAAANVRALHEALPKAQGHASGWTFFANQAYYTPDLVRRIYEAIPDDLVLVEDIWADVNPIYKNYDYFFGREWVFGVLHSMGGWRSLHGDLAGLIRKVGELVDDPRASRCIGFYINPEIIRQNPIYYDLATQLMWSGRAELPRFLEDYCARRYGPDGAPAMLPAVQRLAESVYSTDDNTTPFYQVAGWEDSLENARTRAKFLPDLREALGLALAAKEQLAQNPLYARDVIEIARQYLGDLWNSEEIRLRDAAFWRDRVAFEATADALRRILNSQEELLSTHPDYWVQTQVDQASNLPGQSPAVAGEIRQRYSSWGPMDQFFATGVQDYCRKDLWELLRFYYRPRMEYMISTLRKQMETGQAIAFPPIDDPEYRRICEDWIETNRPFPKEAQYPGSSLDAAAEVLADNPLDLDSAGEATSLRRELANATLRSYFAE